LLRARRAHLSAIQQRNGTARELVLRTVLSSQWDGGVRLMHDLAEATRVALCIEGTLVLAMLALVVVLVEGLA